MQLAHVNHPGDMETCVRVARNVISFELLRASTRKVKDVVASSLLLTSMFMTSSQAIGAKNSIESARAGKNAHCENLADGWRAKYMR